MIGSNMPYEWEPPHVDSKYLYGSQSQVWKSVVTTSLYPTTFVSYPWDLSVLNEQL